MILEWAILHDEDFHSETLSAFWCYCFCTFTYVKFWIQVTVFLHCSSSTFTWVKHATTSSTNTDKFICSLDITLEGLFNQSKVKKLRQYMVKCGCLNVTPACSYKDIIVCLLLCSFYVFITMLSTILSSIISLNTSLHLWVTTGGVIVVNR